MAGRRIDPVGRPPWAVRRRIIYLTLIFCAGLVIYVVGFGDDNELNRTALTCAFMLAFSVIGAFVFGAVWDDRNVMQILGPRAYQDQLPYGGMPYAAAGLPAEPIDEPGVGQ